MTFSRTVVCLLFASSLAHAEVTCETKAAASCDADGMCFDFFDGSVGDSEAWEGMCDAVEGTFKEAPCDRSQAVLSCLAKGNPVMPVLHFKADFTYEDATQACQMQSGVICRR